MLAEETVVIAFAPADAVALAVKRDPRHYNEVEIAGLRFVLRFQNVEIAHGKCGVLTVFNRNDVIADHGRQDDGFLQMPFLQKRLGLNFVGQSAIKHYPLRLDEVRMLFQFGKDALGLLHQLLLGVLLF